MSIFDAAMKYAETKTPLIILAGHEYGTGSSRDWAAKERLGVKAVVAASFERIHRSNPLAWACCIQFLVEPLRNRLPDGSEIFTTGLSDKVRPGHHATLEIQTRWKITLGAREIANRYTDRD